MVRPRFAKLPPTRQHAILRAAREEFAGHGFHDASLNRVIETAEISKGSMYYYFDDKEDLYAYVVTTEVERLFAETGPFAIATSGDADSFWSTMESHYLRLMAALVASPQVRELLRNWPAAPGHPVLNQARQRMEGVLLPWLEHALATGQAVGAVRTDLPSDLLIAVVVGMGQAMDNWLVAQEPAEGALAEQVGTLMGMVRAALR